MSGTTEISYVAKIVNKLASGIRFSGTLFAYDSARYIIEQYQSFGLEVEVQDFKFMGWKPIEGPKVRLVGPPDEEIASLPVIWSGSTPDDGVRGELLYLGTTLTFEGYAWRKYAVVDKNGEHVAYIITRPDAVWLQPLDDPSITTPCVAVDTDGCRKIEERLKSGKPTEGWVYFKTQYEPQSQLRNIHATLSGSKETRRRVIVCAHYDSMWGSQGANDNATGVAALLSVAQILAKRGFPKTVQFIAFDGEEWNKLGANTFLKSLQESGEIENIDLILNIDTIGAGDYIYLCHGFKSTDDRLQMHKKIKMDRILKGTIRKQGGVQVEESPNLFKLGNVTVEFRSEVRPPFDHWPFYKIGIPIVQFGCGPYKHFHVPTDTIDKINFSLIEQVVEIVLQTLEDIAYTS